MVRGHLIFRGVSNAIPSLSIPMLGQHLLSFRSLLRYLSSRESNTTLSALSKLHSFAIKMSSLEILTVPCNIDIWGLSDNEVLCARVLVIPPSS